MSSITDLILSQVKSSAAGIQIPSASKETVLNGLSSSVLGSLTQTAATTGGIDKIKDLLTGKTSAAQSPVTGLATKIFTNDILSKLNLGSATNGALTGIIPTIMSGLSNIIKDRDGDGDVDLNDILLSLKGGNTGGGGLLGSLAGGLLGGLFGKKR